MGDELDGGIVMKDNDAISEEMAESKRRADRMREVSESFEKEQDPAIAKMLAEIEANNNKFKK